MDIEKKFADLCREPIESLGYNLVRVSWAERELCLYIDKKDGCGVDLADCEKVTQAVEPLIDGNDSELGENYNLSVSSVGTDGKDWR